MDLERGGAAQVFKNEEYGITLFALREDRNSKFKQTWCIEILPGREFVTYRELRDAVNGEKSKGGKS
jgi:hypothetical protein